jgi:hypothetical protein
MTAIVSCTRIHRGIGKSALPRSLLSCASTSRLGILNFGMLTYLSRYTNRVAIANSRLIACDRNKVAFRWKDYRAEGRDRQKVMTLATAEFIRRFLIHVLPHGFHRIRHYGLLASSTRAGNIARARRLLDVPVVQPKAGDDSGAEAAKPEPLSCPCCGGCMIIIETFQRGSSPRSRPAASTAVIRIDTS